ncbi:MAG: glycosyltransferase family 2 protein, partial [Actinomycetota bacterium]|nr:glycosyltransferase family 2 protein [Actinomycetota bacterium]
GLLVLPAAAGAAGPDGSPLRAYALSVASSRAAIIAGDAVLRRTPLTGRGALALPAVSVVVSSKRPDLVETCLDHLGAQTYPSYEIVLGAHGYDVDERLRSRWSERTGGRLRVVRVPAEATLGEVLGRLSRLADGDLLTKVDDDDHYGPSHLTDLVLARRTSGADLVSKSSRWTHFADEGVTIDRVRMAPEVFDVTPAGATMLLPRDVLAEAGGWSASVRHVDTDLLARLHAIGAVRYQTHALEYIYVWRSTGHTWAADHAALLEQGGEVFEGLPPLLLDATVPY